MLVVRKFAYCVACLAVATFADGGELETAKWQSAIDAANAAGGYSSQARQAVNQAQSAMNAAQRAASSASESAAAAQAAVVNAADNGSVDASGLISFRHGTTELFTVQLPLYDGSVTYGS